MKAKEFIKEDWNKVNHHDKTNGLSQKAVNSYRHEHPGSKLKTAVTTKPSKLKAGSKDAKRRKSFCARMSGNKGPMKKPNGKPTPKALALRRWHCESVEEMAQLIEHAEQVIAQEKIIQEKWTQKYKKSINCSHPKGFSQKAHCAGRNKNESVAVMEATCPDCGMCKSHGNMMEIAKGAKDSNGVSKCWSGYHAAGTKKSPTTGKSVRNCVKNEGQGVAEAGNKPLERSRFGMGDDSTPRELKTTMSSASDDHVKAVADQRPSVLDTKVRSMQHKLAKSELRKRGQGVAEGSLNEYGDTARGQKMLTRVQKRAVDRVIKTDDKNRLEPDHSKRDLKTVRKNQDTADRAYDRMTDMDEAAKHGLYYNVNKRKAAGTSRSASSPKAPTAQAWKDAAKTAKK